MQDFFFTSPTQLIDLFFFPIEYKKTHHCRKFPQDHSNWLPVELGREQRLEEGKVNHR